MTKREIILKIADETDLKQVEVKMVVQKTLDAVIESLSKGEPVELRNFGIFRVKSRKKRVGRNPKTGDVISVPEKKVVHFKAGLTMKEKVK